MMPREFRLCASGKALKRTIGDPSVITFDKVASCIGD